MHVYIWRVHHQAADVMSHGAMCSHINYSGSKLFSVFLAIYFLPHAVLFSCDKMQLIQK